MFDFLVINPQYDTPENLFIAFFLAALVIWSSIRLEKQHKKDEEEEKNDPVFY